MQCMWYRLSIPYNYKLSFTSTQGGITKVNMPNTDSSRGAAQKPVVGEAAQKEVIFFLKFSFILLILTIITHPLTFQELKKNTENFKKFETLLTKLEAEFFAIIMENQKYFLNAILNAMFADFALCYRWLSSLFSLQRSTINLYRYRIHVRVIDHFFPCTDCIKHL